MTTTTTPADEAVRQQAIGQVSESIALSAGAGAGKTSVLVKRLVQHLLAGVPPRAIAAITFTRAAANELASRSRDAFEVRLSEASKAGDRAKVALLEGIIGQLGELTVSTIHSFCQDLLLQEALESRWAPDTEVANIQGSAALESVYQSWRADFNDRHPRWGLLLRRWAQDEAPFNGTSVRTLVDTLLANQDLEPWVADAQSVDLEVALDELEAIRGEIVVLMGKCLKPQTCKLYAKVVPVPARLEEFLALEGEASVFAAMEYDVPRAGRAGRAGDWASGAKTALLDAVKSLMTWQERWKTCIGEQIHRALIDDFKGHYLPAFKAARLDNAQADFSDLLFRSRELLVGSLEARRRLSARYQVVLIDEVQDTDPIQAEVAALLTRAEPQEEPWHSGAPVAGQLFAVGDPKQSIYRFRRADVAVWRNLQGLIARQGHALALECNFRSVPGIVNWVNHTFAQLPDFQPQRAERSAAELDPVVQVQVEPGQDEIDALVRHFCALKASKARVYDKEREELRPVEDRDLLILVPAWTNAADIQERMILAGVECTVEGGKSFFKRDEIRLSLAAMRVIDEPQDSEAAVCALRGLFGISHAELVRHRAAGGSWSSLSPSQPPGDVGEALKLLGRLHKERHKHSWVELLDEVLAHTGATAVWSLMKRRWSALANLDKFRTLIRQLEPRTRSSTEVLEALLSLEAGSGTEDLSVVDDDNQAARVMTYFKAKGLEAPVVAVVCANRKTPSIQGATVTREGGGDALAVVASKTIVPPGWADFEQAEKEENREERRRWMYVAATRARDQLVMVRSKASKALFEMDVNRGLGPATEDGHATVYDVAKDVQVRTFMGHLLPPVVYDESTFPGLDLQVDELLIQTLAGGDPKGEERQRGHLELVAASRRSSSRWRSVGNLTMRKMVEMEGGGVGPRGGDVVHRVMEHLDLTRPDDELRALVPELTRAFATVVGIQGEVVERCQEVILRLLELPIIDEARRAPELWREVPFAYPERGIVVAGRIDLCFPVDPGRTRWKVVDWKSHLPPTGSELHKIYQRQLAYYAQALLETVTPCRHVEPVLAGPHQELGHADWLAEKLELVIPELVDLVSALAEAKAEPEIGYEPEFRQYVQLELAWPQARLGLGLDLTDKEAKLLKNNGWRVAQVQTQGATWAQEAADKVFELLGLSALTNDDDEEAP